MRIRIWDRRNAVTATRNSINDSRLSLNAGAPTGAPLTVHRHGGRETLTHKFESGGGEVVTKR